MSRAIVIKRSVIDSILSYCRYLHPREGILLLRGKTEKDRIIVDNVEIPPFATHGRGFSTFPLHMLPIDFTVIGTAHSHPTGNPQPSTKDLNNFYGKIMIIATYPYYSEQQITAYNSQGKPTEYKIEVDE
jgi:proteasome lid subunit RPN8/RPN11